MKKPKTQPARAGVQPKRMLDLPSYTSMQHCHSHTGIPMEVIKWAKTQAGAGYRNSRIELSPLLRWLMNRVEPARLIALLSTPQQGELPLPGPESAAVKVGGRAALDEYKAQREKIRLEKDLDEVVSKPEVKAGTQQGIAELFGTLERILCNEMPPTLIGLRELEIRKKIRNELDIAKEELRKRFEALALVEETESVAK